MLKGESEELPAGTPPLDREGLAERVRDGGQRFRDLPEHPAPADLGTGEEVDAAPDPDGGRNPDRDWMLRWGNG